MRHDESQHPRGVDGRWVAKTAGAPAASLPEPTGTEPSQRVVDADTLNTDRRAVHRALDDLIDAEITHVDSLVRELLKPGQSASVSVRDGQVMIEEVWHTRTGDIINDSFHHVPATPRAAETIAMRRSITGAPHKVDADGPSHEQAVQEVAQATQAHAQASSRMVGDVLTVVDQQRDAQAVELQTRYGQTAGTVTVAGLVVHRADGRQERYGAAGDEWDSFAHPIAEDLDPRALEALPRDDRGRINMVAWRDGRASK